MSFIGSTTAYPTVVPAAANLVPLIVSGVLKTATVQSLAVESVNAQTGTTYTVVTGDRGKLVTLSNAAAIAVTLPQASATFPDGWWCDVQVKGAGTATITPTTSTINGAATLVLTTGQSARIVSDGTDYRALIGSGGVGVAADTIWDTAGDLVQATGANTAAKLPIGTAGQVLTVNGGATAAAWSTPAVASVAADAIWDAAGDLAQGTGANTAAKLAIGTAGQVLTVNGGATAVEWAAPASGAVATDTIWDTAGDLVQGTGANTAAKLAIGTALQVLRVNAGATAVEWAASASGSTQGAHDVPLVAGSWYADQTSGATWGTGNGAADQPDSAYWAFDQTTEQAIWTVLEAPKSWDEGAITFHVKWKHPATTTNFGAVWSVRAVALGDGEALATSYGTAQTSTDTGGATDTVYSSPESSAITIANTPATRDLVFLELRRKPSDGSDTMAVAAHLLSVTVSMTTNADTDA